MSRYSNRIYKYNIELDISPRLCAASKISDSFIHNSFKRNKLLYSILISYIIYRNYNTTKYIESNKTITGDNFIRQLLLAYFPNTIKDACNDINKKSIDKLIRNDKYDKIIFKEEFQQFYNALEICINDYYKLHRSTILFEYNYYINNIVHYILADNNYSSDLSYNNFISVDAYSIMHPELLYIMVEGYMIHTLYMPKYIDDIKDNLSYRRFVEILSKHTFYNDYGARYYYNSNFENHDFNIKRDLNLVFMLEFTLDKAPYKILVFNDIVEISTAIDGNTIRFYNNNYEPKDAIPIEYIYNASDLLIEAKYYYSSLVNHSILYADKAFTYDFKSNKFELNTWRIDENV